MVDTQLSTFLYFSNLLELYILIYEIFSYLILFNLIFLVFFFFNLTQISNLLDIKFFNTYNFFFISILFIFLSLTGIPPFLEFLNKFFLSILLFNKNAYLFVFFFMHVNMFMIYFYIQNTRFLIKKFNLLGLIISKYYNSFFFGFIFLLQKLVNYSKRGTQNLSPSFEINISNFTDKKIKRYKKLQENGKDLDNFWGENYNPHYEHKFQTLVNLRRDQIKEAIQLLNKKKKLLEQVQAFFDVQKEALEESKKMYGDLSLYMNRLKLHKQKEETLKKIILKTDKALKKLDEDLKSLS